MIRDCTIRPNGERGATVWHRQNNSRRRRRCGYHAFRPYGLAPYQIYFRPWSFVTSKDTFAGMSSWVYCIVFHPRNKRSPYTYKYLFPRVITSRAKRFFFLNIIIIVLLFSWHKRLGPTIRVKHNARCVCFLFVSIFYPSSLRFILINTSKNNIIIITSSSRVPARLYKYTYILCKYAVIYIICYRCFKYPRLVFNRY